MPFRVILVDEDDELPREGHKLDYLPFGVRTLKLKVEGDLMKSQLIERLFKF